MKKGARRKVGLEKVVCWKCRERGRYQKDCKQEAAGFVGRKPATNFKAPNEMYKTGCISGSCKSLMASGSIEGSDCQITIDTGSNISIMRPDILQRSEGKKPIQPVDSCLWTMTGEKHPSEEWAS